MNLDPSKASYYKSPGFTIVAPPNVALSMSTEQARIMLDGDTAPSFVRFKSKSIKREPNGKLTANASRPGNVSYRFDLIELPPLSARGKFELPPIYANGQQLAVPVFSFERRSFVGVIPLDC